MPRLKDEFDTDVEALENAEYDEGGSFSNYDGEEPPRGTILSGFVKKLWLSETRNGDPMLISLFEAASNEGDEEQFNGWATWDYMALTSGAKFRWAPFFEVTGIALRDLLGRKSRLWVEEDNDNFGTPIEKIGEWVPGEDNDLAWVRVITKVETKGEYKGRGKIDKWLHWEDSEGGEEPEDEPEYEEPEEQEEVEEEVEETPVPTRRSSRSSAAKPSAPAKPAARASAATAKPAATPAARSTATRRPAARAATAASKPAARGRGGRAASGSTEEPPF